MKRYSWILGCVSLCLLWEARGAIRDEALQQVGDKVIVPQVVEFVAKAELLQRALEAWVTDGSDAKRQEAANAWKEARLSWKRGTVSLFGPAKTLHSRARVDFSPANLSLLLRTVNGNAVLDATYVEEQLGASQKGLGALEYFLFPSKEGDELLQGGEAKAKRARQFAALIGENLVGHARRHAEAWKTFEPQLAKSGQEGVNQVASQVSAELDIVMNQSFGLWIKALEGGANARLTGIRSGHVGRDIDAVIMGVESMVNGRNGIGFDEVVKAAGSPAGKNLSEALKKVRAAVEVAEKEKGVEQVKALRTAQETCRVALRIVRTEWVSALGATLLFNDNDGD